jgi:hypothetical protein
VYRVTELALPFLSVAPKPFEAVAGLLTVAFHGWLLPTGKVSWLNWLTVVLAVSTFEDAVIAAVLSLLAGLLDGDDGLRSPPDRPVRRRAAAIRSDAALTLPVHRPRDARQDRPVVGPRAGRHRRRTGLARRPPVGSHHRPPRPVPARRQ